MGEGPYEYEWTGPSRVWFGVQTVDGATAEAEPGGRILLAEPGHIDGLAPSNQAAIDAAEQYEAAIDPPLAERVGDMKVADVLPLLDALGPVELADVRDAENSGGARVTILARIDELLAADGPGADDVEEAV
jgi:hypothetical protein